jgi:hypothetical protein
MVGEGVGGATKRTWLWPADSSGMPAMAAARRVRWERQETGGSAKKKL